MEAKEIDLLEHINSNVDAIAQKVQQESKRLRVLSGFFQTVRKELERFSNTVQKEVDGLKVFFDSSNECSEFIVKLLRQHEDFAGTLKKYATSLQPVVIESLDAFIRKYEERNREVIQGTNKIIENIKSQRKKISNAQRKYFKENAALLTIEKEDEYKAKQAITEELKGEYKDLVTHFNQSRKANKENYKHFLRTWQQNEEAKICYVKVMYQSVHTLLHEFDANWVKLFATSSRSVEGMSEAIDFAHYMPKVTGSKHDLFAEAVFEVPESAIKDLLNEQIVEYQFPQGVTESDTQFLEAKVNDLLNDQPIPESAKEKILIMERTSEGLYAACKCFIDIKQKTELENEEVFKAILELAMVALDQLDGQKFPEGGYLFAVVTVGNSVLYIKDNAYSSRKHIRDMIINHPIWRRKRIWNRILDYKISHALEILEAHMKLSGKKSGKVSAQNTEETKRAGRRGIYFSEIALIVSEMVFYNTDKAACRELIVSYCNEVGIERDKLYQLLSDCEAAQILPREEESRKYKYSMLKREGERKKYGYSKSTIVVGMSIKFLGDLSTLLNILLVSRDWSGIFKLKVQQTALKLYSNKIRFPLWQAMLHSQGLGQLYPKLKEHTSANLMESNKELFEVIRLDVIRSFSGHSKTDQEALMSVLRTYSTLNTEVGYCQGMNYIAGFLYFIYKDEAVVFDMLCSLIANFNLSGLFKSGVPLLRVYFYQLNRLIAVFLPRLHSHFFKEGTNSTYFASTWLLTVFTHVIQYTKDTKPPLLLLIFDSFLSKGVKASFKASLFILEHFEEILLNTRYDGILQVLNEIHKPNFLYDKEIIRKYKERTKSYNITEELLERLNDEYKELHKIAETGKIVEKELLVPFKHYTYSSDGEKLFSIYFPS
eukprot:TRINITY_DN5061_c0_g2_i1.p1 TRINITY_DN5061_c0_g2~~TRINITY_DN5061_c0_g2_i1.p1  ORF type:complete len:885 (+),score=233.52 TRINITY_DN5061_c0_g2_i1:142-2796(+)